MTPEPSSTAAFTLIEILIVLAIAAAGFSLVGPGLFRSYEKIRAEAEEQRLEMLLQTTRSHCFLNRETLKLSFAGPRIEVKETTEEETTGSSEKASPQNGSAPNDSPEALPRTSSPETKFQTFHYLEFPENTIVFNRNGFSDSKFLPYRCRGRAREMPLQ